LFFPETIEDVFMLEYFETDGEMMILEYALIIVHDGEFGSRVDKELICESRMIRVMNGRGKDGCHFLQMCKYTIEGWGFEEIVRTAHNIRSMTTIMIWNWEIVIL
jgi:hypothetical protein